MLLDDTKRRLSSLDRRELSILVKTFSCLDGPLDDQNSDRALQAVAKSDRDPTDLLNLIDISMRRFVKSAKDLSAFRQITQEGKLQLLKGMFFRNEFVNFTKQFFVFIKVGRYLFTCALKFLLRTFVIIFI